MYKVVVGGLGVVNRFKALFYLKTTPYSQVVYRIFYHHKTKKGKRDWFFSYLLALLIILIGLLFSSSIEITRYTSLDLDFCENSNEKISNYTAIMEEAVDLEGAKNHVEKMETETTTAYNCSDDDNANRANWPEAYEMDEETRAELLAASDLQCTQKLCWKEKIASFKIKLKCKKVSYSCPDASAVYQLASYEEREENYEKPEDIESPETDISETAEAQLVEQIEILSERINLLSTIYCFYLALQIFLGPALVLSKPTLFSKLTFGDMNKGQWIIIALIIWYSWEALTIYTQTPEFQAYWDYFKAEPCWINSQFITDYNEAVYNTCYQMEVYGNRYNHSRANYKYYYNIDETYHSFTGDNNCFDGNWYDQQSFPYSCNETQLEDLAIPETIEDFNYYDFIVSTGLLASLVLQPILAHIVLAIFSLIQPLSLTSGRVLLPLSQFKKILKYTDVRKKFRKTIITFKRLNSIIPLILWLGILIWLISEDAIPLGT
ncbi:hypothetical protein M0812_12836 [Anaeramoeba flamelloides]|uniref:Uncharacterized protein n=1 Tax=Anaeramoeba flamelloides TaxID=1746091 RepID=A0AAV7ZPW3_9EUKA|nr:hypothetical protein M0812_12836 [Anaeramoeba flamelloides]